VYAIKQYKLIKRSNNKYSRDRVDRVEHSTRILRSPHRVGLEHLPNSRIKVGRVNPIELKLDPTITLTKTISALLSIQLLLIKTMLS